MGRRNTAFITPTSKFKIMNFYLISSLTFVILTWVSSGDALKCNQCTSHEHTQCGDPFYYEDELGNKTVNDTLVSNSNTTHASELHWKVEKRTKKYNTHSAERSTKLCEEMNELSEVADMKKKKIRKEM